MTMIFSPKLVKRYRELEAEALRCFLLMQVGAFMDVMDQDARLVLRYALPGTCVQGGWDAGAETCGQRAEFLFGIV